MKAVTGHPTTGCCWSDLGCATQSHRQRWCQAPYPGKHLMEMPTNMPRAGTDRRNVAAVTLSRLGASKGGYARAKALSAEQRLAIAKKAAAARWAKK